MFIVIVIITAIFTTGVMVSNLARKKLILGLKLFSLESLSSWILHFWRANKDWRQKQICYPPEGASSKAAELIYILEQSNNKTCAGTENLGQASTRHESPARKVGHEC